LHRAGRQREQKDKTERQNRRTKQKDKTDGQNRKTKQKDKTERQNKKSLGEREKVKEKRSNCSPLDLSSNKVGVHVGGWFRKLKRKK
jgi:hypothetical protein